MSTAAASSLTVELLRETQESVNSPSIRQAVMLGYFLRESLASTLFLLALEAVPLTFSPTLGIPAQVAT
jgi:hypothetical protein